MTWTSPLLSRPLTAVLAGLGGMGEVWLSALSGPEAVVLGVELVGVCDVDPDKAIALLAHRQHRVPAFEHFSDALALQPDILIDCTTPNARLAVTREALLAGSHVLCEKPLAADEKTAAQLIGAASRANGVLAVSQNRRFQPGLRQLRDLVRSRRLGSAQTLFADLHMAPRFGGFREAMRHVMLRDMAIHAFDGARCILGTDALSVSCLERTPAGQPFAHGPEIHAIFEMVDGSLFVFHGNWAEHGPPSSWNATWRLALSGGAARWDGEGVARAWTPAPSDASGLLPDALPHPLPPAPPEHSDILGSLESFVSAIRLGRPPETHARDNAASLAMVFAAMRSAENEGQRETVHRLRDVSDASGLSRRITAREG